MNHLIIQHTVLLRKMSPLFHNSIPFFAYLFQWAFSFSFLCLCNCVFNDFIVKFTMQDTSGKEISYRV